MNRPKITIKEMICREGKWIGGKPQIKRLPMATGGFPKLVTIDRETAAFIDANNKASCFRFDGKIWKPVPE